MLTQVNDRDDLALFLRLSKLFRSPSTPSTRRCRW